MRRFFMILGSLVPLLVSGLAKGQTLEAVLSSIQERHNVLRWKAVLNPATGDPYDGLQPQPLIQWDSAAQYPAESSLGSISVAQRIGLLNHAVVEFETMAPRFFQLQKTEDKLGILQLVTIPSGQRLPRVTVANYHAVLQELALRVDTLRVLPWKADNRVAKYVNFDLDSKPSSLANSSWEEDEPGTYNAYNEGDYWEENVGAFGSWDSSVTPPAHPGNMTWRKPFLKFSASLGNGSGIQGKVTAFLKQEQSGASDVSYKNNAVEYGKGWQKMGSLDNGPLEIEPSFEVGGSWLTVYQTAEKFVAAGLSDPDAYPPLQDAGPDWLFRSYNIYNAKWAMLLEPTFSKGLSTTSQQAALATLSKIRREGQVCDIVVNPPDAANGISLSISGIGQFSVGTPVFIKAYDDQSIELSNIWPFKKWEVGGNASAGVPESLHGWLSPAFRGPRFESGGQRADVRYETGYGVNKRVPMLAWPENPLEAREGWPGYVSYYYRWQAPRLRQVIGRDLIVDVDYAPAARSDYLTVVKVYRVPPGTVPEETTDGFVSTADLVLWKEYRFKAHSLDSAGYAQSALKMDIEEVGALTHEINWTVQPTPDFDPMDPYGVIPPNLTGWSVTSKSGTNTVATQVVTLTPGSNYKIECVRTLNGASLPKQTWLMPVAYYTDQWASYKEEDGSVNRLWAFEYPEIAYPIKIGTRFPSKVTFTGTKDQSGSTEWNNDGTLKNTATGSWTQAFTYGTSTCDIDSKYSGSTYQKSQIKWEDGATKITTTTTPDGGTNISAGDWSKVTLNTATTGIPLAPTRIDRADGTGVDFTYTGTETVRIAETPGGIDRTVTTNERGYLMSEVVKLKRGGTVQIGGATLSQPTDWGANTRSTAYVGGVQTNWSYAPDGVSLASHTDGLGLAQSWSYDGLAQVSNVGWNGSSSAITRSGPQTSFNLTGAGISGNVTQDAFGRATAGSSTSGQSVTWSAAETDSQISYVIDNLTTSAGLATTVKKTNGTLGSASGNVLPSTVSGTSFEVDNDGLFRTTETAAGGISKTVWTDSWGRVRKTEGPGARSAEITYAAPNASTQKQTAVLSSGERVIRELDVATGTTRSGLDLNNSSSLGSGDRYTETTVSVTGGVVRTTVSGTDAGGFREFFRTDLTPSSGVSQTVYNGGEETLISTPDFSNRKVTTSSSKGWSSTRVLNALGQLQSSGLSGTGIPSGSSTLSYDGGGRLTGASSTIGGITTAANWTAAGLLTSLTNPLEPTTVSAHGFSGGKENITLNGRTYQTAFNGMSHSETGGDGWPFSSTTNFVTGGFQRTLDPALGGNTVEKFNAAGDKKAHEYPSGPADTAVVGDSGQVTSESKGGHTIGYRYEGAYKLDVTHVDYPAAGGLPARTVTLPPGAAGEPQSISDSFCSIGFGYDKGRVTAETYGGSTLAGYSITRGFDTSGRAQSVDLKRSLSLLFTSYGYEGASDELSSITAGGLATTYTRQASTRGITGANKSGVNLTWGRDNLGRITAAGSSFGGGSIAGAPATTGTTFDGRGRRETITTDEGVWTYHYQSDGQLEWAKLGSDLVYSYTFDELGRRTSSSAPNGLNQPYTRSRVQSALLVLTADAAAAVKIDGVLVTPFSGLVTKVLTTSNPAGGWVPWEVEGRLTGGGANGTDRVAKQSGYTWLPPATETYTHNNAGQRSADSQFDFEWDSAGRLVQATTKNLGSVPRGIEAFYQYDALGRRIHKQVIRYENGVGQTTKNTTYAWDGWHLAYELCRTAQGVTEYERRYVWGLDLSGTLGGAGGAGGLLYYLETRGINTVTYHPIYDTIGNVTGLVDGGGTLAATYRWGPFGEIREALGKQSTLNPIRWATKYQDEETGLCYFGYRYYDPGTGAWLSREPLGEQESLNLYAYCHNDPINNVDVLGLHQMYVANQAEADRIRLRWLIEQLGEGIQSPVAPTPWQTQGYPSGSGVFGGFTPEDFARARAEISGAQAELKRVSAAMLGPSSGPSMRSATPEEIGTGGPVMQPYVMPPVSIAALTVGANYSSLLANINAGFVTPGGGGAFAFSSVMRGFQYSRALSMGVSLERSMLISGLNAELKAGALTAGNTSILASTPRIALIAENTTLKSLSSGGSGLTFSYNAANRTAFHTVTSPGAGQGVLSGINPRFLNPDSRFGKAFYISDDAATTLAELAHHNATGTHTIRYNLNLNKANVLDFTNSSVAKTWGYVGGDITPATQAIGIRAIEAGYNVIKFPSLRGPGTNYGVLSNFDELISPQMIVPTP